jgi:phage virion morphogenesis protein
MIEIKIDDYEVKSALNDLLKKVKDMSPVMKKIAGIMHDAVEENFEKEGRPRWKPLSARTIAQRQKKGYWPGAILQMRGELAASISQSSDNDTAMVGTNKVYAAIHQFGGKAGRGHKAQIPARPFLKLTDDDLDEIKKAIEEYLKGV